VSGSQVSDTPAGEAHMHAPVIAESEPQGDLCIRTLAMPADTNANGDIFGGWLLSQMDLGGGVFASKITKSRTVTVAIEAMNFRKPVFVGDLVSVHANLVRIGKTSITVHLEGLGAASYGAAIDPGDRRKIYLRLDRRPWPAAGHCAGHADRDVKPPCATRVRRTRRVGFSGESVPQALPVSARKIGSSVAIVWRNDPAPASL